MTVTGREEVVPALAVHSNPWVLTWLWRWCLQGHWGCSHCHAALTSRALSLWGEDAAVVALPCVEGKLLLAVILFLPGTSPLVLLFSLPGLGSTPPISIRKGCFLVGEWLPGKPGGAERLEEDLPVVRVSIVASLK